MACFPCNSIEPAGKFVDDERFAAARRVLDELMGQMRQQQGQQGWCQPAGRVDYLLAELAAWQQQGQNLSASLNAGRHDELFPTVFRFEPLCVQMVIDARGFQPANLRLTVEGEMVLLEAFKEEAASGASTALAGQNCVGYASRRIRVSYTLPQKVVKERVSCSLSQDGTLYVSAPWMWC